MHIYLGFTLPRGSRWARKLSLFDDRHNLGFLVFDREVFGKKAYHREKKALNSGLISWKDTVSRILEWAHHFKVLFYKFHSSVVHLIKRQNFRGFLESIPHDFY